METILEETTLKLEKLRKHFNNSTWSTIYLICGNEKAGKNTLAHYIIGADLVYDVDEEGQEVLTIQDESETVTIV